MPSAPGAVDCPRVRVVSSFTELISTPFENGVNALCWPRELPGDYAEVMRALNLMPGITHLEEDQLQALSLSPEGYEAVRVMLDDLELLRSHGLDPVLDGIHGYTHEPQTGPVRTDVCSFHADSATAEVDTWLCTYHGASSEGLPNEQAIRRVDDSATRAALLREYGGAEDESFHEWLSDHYFDLHYMPLPDARPYVFGIGNLWRIATQHPGCAGPPCIHRAPDPVPGEPRLLLIT